MPMIVCMNINSAGERYIAYIRLSERNSRSEVCLIAIMYKECYDEVYVIDIDTSNDFINAIVLRGTRI